MNVTLNYREDANLSFLQSSGQAELKMLANILVYKREGQKRIGQQLADHPVYRDNQSDLAEVWQLIAAELQRFGGDTVANVVRRGQGVPYGEILKDVCKRCKVKLPAGSRTIAGDLEDALLRTILSQSLEKLDEEQLRELAKVAKLNVSGMTRASMVPALQAAIHAGGFASYQLAVIVANAVARALFNQGLSLAGNAALTRGMAMFAGPVGIAIGMALTVPLFSGPAYSVTVPACIQIAYMRQQYLIQAPLSDEAIA